MKAFETLGGLLLAAASLVPGTSSGAGVHRVPTDFATIQSAIDATPAGDTIFVAAGTWTGPDNKNLTFHGKNLLLIGESGADVTIIDCENDGRAFLFNSGETAASLVRGFTMQNSGHLLAGGGVDCSDGSSPRIEECHIHDNHTTDGGGVYCSGGAAPTFTGCVITDNSTTGQGGGVSAALATPIFVNCVISGNQAAMAGGGVYGYCPTGQSLILSACRITGNKGADGGGLYLGLSRDFQVNGCTVAGNVATGGGGGVFIGPGAGAAFVAALIWGNCAAEGPGMVISAGARAGLSCSDFLQSEIASSGTLSPGPDNQSDDPVFCEPKTCAEAPTSSGNYGIKPSSPLIDALCGLIGGIGKGCEDVPVVPTTWGAIKALRR